MEKSRFAFQDPYKGGKNFKEDDGVAGFIREAQETRPQGKGDRHREGEVSGIVCEEGGALFWQRAESQRKEWSAAYKKVTIMGK